MEGTRATFNGSGKHYFQITSKYPLPHSTTRYRVRVSYQKDWMIRVGLITQARKEENISGWQDHPNSVSYGSGLSNRAGEIFVEGAQLQVPQEEDLFIENGGTIELEAKLTPLDPCLTFVNVSNSKSWTVPLPGQYLTEAVYLFAQMSEKGDSVEVLA